MSVFDYDTQVAEIKAYNQPILQSFHDGLVSAGLAEKTIKSHVENIEFFVEYLVSYDPLKRLDEADGGDVRMFLMDWFPRKAMWASLSSVKSYLASFKKFFKWMDDTDRISSDTVADVLAILKGEREDFLAAVSDFEDDDDTMIHTRDKAMRKVRSKKNLSALLKELEQRYTNLS